MNLVMSLLLAFGMSGVAHADQTDVDPSVYTNPMFSKVHLYNQSLQNHAPEKLNTIIRMDFASFKEVPTMFKGFLPGKDFDRPEAISVYLAVSNDYNFLAPIGVNVKTDDQGYTHGSRFSIGGFLPEGYYLSVDYSTDLYTKPIKGTTQKLADGSRSGSQYFTNENILKVVLDNMDKPRTQAYYWRAEAGWQKLSSDTLGGYASGATQQEKFHELVNSLNKGQTRTPINVPDGLEDRDGLILGMYVGIAKEYLNAKNTCRVRGFTEVGSRGSTIDGASFVASNIGGTLWCQQAERTMTFKTEVGYESKVYQDGYQGTAYADISTGKGSWRVGFRFEQSYGELINYANYNLRNYHTDKIDPIFTIYYRRYF